jgi:hypothetical protein
MLVLFHDLPVLVSVIDHRTAMMFSGRGSQVNGSSDLFLKKQGMCNE